MILANVVLAGIEVDVGVAVAVAVAVPVVPVVAHQSKRDHPTLWNCHAEHRHPPESFFLQDTSNYLLANVLARSFIKFIWFVRANLRSSQKPEQVDPKNIRFILEPTSNDRGYTNGTRSRYTTTKSPVKMIYPHQTLTLALLFTILDSFLGGSLQ